MKQMNLNPAAYLVWGFANIPPIVAAINRAAPDFRVRLRLYLRLLKMYLYSNGQITALTILFNALYAMLPDRWADRLHAR